MKEPRMFDGRVMLALRALKDQELHSPMLWTAQRKQARRDMRVIRWRQRWAAVKPWFAGVAFAVCAGAILTAWFVIGWYE